MHILRITRDVFLNSPETETPIIIPHGSICIFNPQELDNDGLGIYINVNKDIEPALIVFLQPPLPQGLDCSKQSLPITALKIIPRYGITFKNLRPNRDYRILILIEGRTCEICWLLSESNHDLYNHNEAGGQVVLTFRDGSSKKIPTCTVEIIDILTWQKCPVIL